MPVENSSRRAAMPAAVIIIQGVCPASVNEFEPASVSWNEKDVMLYALGVGARPSRDLDFIYEARGPNVLPTFVVIPGMRAMGSINKVVQLPIARLLHGEQGITRQSAPAEPVQAHPDSCRVGLHRDRGGQ